MLDVPGDVLVRAGGSALFTVVGVAAIVLAKGRRGALALGAFLALWGVNLAFNNLARYDEAVRAVWAPFSAFSELAVGIALVFVALGWPEPVRPHERGRAAVALGVAALFTGILLAEVLVVPGGWTTIEAGRSFPLVSDALVPWEYFGTRVFFGAVVAVSLLLPLRFAASRPDEERFRAQLVLAGLAFGVPWAQAVSDVVVGSQALWLVNGFLLVLAIGLPFVWIAAGRRVDARRARNVAHALLAVSLASLAVAAFVVAWLNPLVGVTRVVVAAAWAYGIVRLGFLGYDIQLRTAQRGTVAMAALATLFIVAQVAQEFLSAQYGLLMGGVVAGALLFAAAPIQRAFERAGGPSEAREPATHQQDTYRRAVRLALRDRRLTAEEEVELAHVAHGLGLTAPEATRIRHEVERERREEAA